MASGITWKNTLASITHRDWSSISDILRLYTKDAYDYRDEYETLSLAINTKIKPDKDHEKCYLHDNVHKSAISEALILFSKSSHAIRSSFDNAQNGYCSWAAMDSYCAAFFSIKAIAALYGIYIVSLRSENSREDYIIDLYPWMGRKDHTRQFQKEHGSSQDIIGVIRPKIYQIGHKELWELLQRMMNVFSLPYAPNGFSEWVKKSQPREFSSERNSFFYKNQYWLFKDISSVSTLDIKNETFKYDDYQDCEEWALTEKKYFGLSSILFSILIAMWSDIDNNFTFHSGSILNEVLWPHSISYETLHDVVRSNFADVPLPPVA